MQIALILQSAHFKNREFASPYIEVRRNCRDSLRAWAVHH
jgi:hypothetical protein